MTTASARLLSVSGSVTALKTAAVLVNTCGVIGAVAVSVIWLTAPTARLPTVQVTTGRPPVSQVQAGSGVTVTPLRSAGSVSVTVTVSSRGLGPALVMVSV